MDGPPSFLVRVFGCVVRNGEPGPGVEVVLREARGGIVVDRVRTDSRGAFDISHVSASVGTPLELAVPDSRVTPVPIPVSTPVHEVEIELPREGGDEPGSIDGRRAYAAALARLHEHGPALLADAMAGMSDSALPLERVRVLREVLTPVLPDHLLRRGDCETPLYQWLEAVGAELGEEWGTDWEAGWLGDRLGAEANGQKEHVCGPFKILYADGEEGPDPYVSRTPITLPGTAFVLGHTDPQGPPNYIQRVCFWLSFARERFVSAGSFREPLGGGEVVVQITADTSSGAAFKGRLYLNPRHSDDALARYAVHEYMHLIQEEYEKEYGGAPKEGSWLRGREGGSVLAEELVLPAVNAHVGYANDRNGILSQPEISLSKQDYELSLLLLYLAEQHPRGGMWFYRRWLEVFGAAGYDPDVLPPLWADLWPTPPSHGIRHVGAAWSSGDTLLGNFWLACALKDLISSSSDPRFGLVGNGEFALLDRGVRYTRMRPVHVLRETTIRSHNRFTRGDVSVPSYGARFFRFEVPSSVDRVRIEFSATGTLTRPLVQVAVVEPGHRVREIVRTTNTTWAESFDSDQNSLRIHHLWVVVAGAEAGGEFRLSIEQA